MRPRAAPAREAPPRAPGARLSRPRPAPSRLALLFLLSLLSLPARVSAAAYEPGPVDRSSHINLLIDLDTPRDREHGVAVICLHGVRQLTGADFVFAHSYLFQGELRAGPVGVDELYACLTEPAEEERPFYIMHVNGSAISPLVEAHLVQSLCAGNTSSGDFLQTSGLRYSYYPARCIITDIYWCVRWLMDTPNCQQWEALDPDADYLIAVHENMLSGLTGPIFFGPLEKQQSTVGLRAGATRYLRQFDGQSVSPLTSDIKTSQISLTSRADSSDLVGYVVLALVALIAALGNLVFCCSRVRQADAQASGRRLRSEAEEAEEEAAEAEADEERYEVPESRLEEHWPRKKTLMVMAGIDG